jgi:hypothetical protein
VTVDAWSLLALLALTATTWGFWKLCALAGAPR